MNTKTTKTCTKKLTTPWAKPYLSSQKKKRTDSQQTMDRVKKLSPPTIMATPPKMKPTLSEHRYNLPNTGTKTTPFSC